MMADVQLEHGFLRLANTLAAAVARAPWESAAQCRMVMALIRATYGMNRREADVGTAGWRALTGLSDRHIKATKKSLQDAGVFVLVRDFDARAQRPQRWRLEKDFTRWGALTPDVTEPEEWIGDALHQVSGSSPGEPENTGDPVSASSPPPVSAGSPDPVSAGSPGTAGNPLGDNDLEVPKDRKDRKDNTEVVFEHWKEASGHTDAKFLEERKRKIRARLRTYSVEELKTAITNGCADPFYQGQNDRGTRYDWIETLLKNDAAVERHLENGKKSEPETGHGYEVSREELWAEMEGNE